MKQERIPVTRLDFLLEKYLTAGLKIDFLSVDVEGFDLAVLQSNDWALFRPSFVLAEVLGATLEEAINGEIAQFMRAQEYRVFARTYNTLLFCETTK
jgi:hypothetical protein